MNFTEKQLENDRLICERMEQLRDEGKTDTDEYEELHYQYYIQNHYIRIYYKTF